MSEKYYNAVEAEARWREQWEVWRLYRWGRNQTDRETFVIDSPPPTVSGVLHIGHVFSYTHQDLIARYKRMTGKDVCYPMGWDDNGLPTERRVQNYFNVRCDPSLPYDSNLRLEAAREGEPLRISRANFIELCYRMAAEDEKAFKELFTRLGLSIDWSFEYSTISEHSRRVSQLSFIRLFEAGEIYQVNCPSMWDVDFQTAVAQAEMEDREVSALFYDLVFEVEGDDLIIATTRPELLPACVAVMVNPADERYRHLIGKTAITPLFRVRVPIIGDSKVILDKGSGVVMACTFGDVTDVEWWQQYQLPIRQVTGKDGRLEPVKFGRDGFPSDDPASANRAYERLAGLRVEAARREMVSMLRLSSGLSGEPQCMLHSVKFFEKGDRPLEILSTRQWFVRLLEHKEEFKNLGEKISWHPTFMRHRYLDWVSGLNQNWCISRQRYFGVPFPLWYPCDINGNPEYDKPILAPVDSLPVDPLSDTAPGYDESQRDKPGGFTGDPDVQDTWATSALTPQLVAGLEIDRRRYKKLFPMSMRPQSHEIIRTWAFYTIAKAWLHERSVPWKNITISGWVLDPDRKKMSKSRGNIITPLNLLNDYSADAVRYWAARARPGVDTTYDVQVVKAGKKLVTKLYNAGRFVFSNLAGIDDMEVEPSAITSELDRSFVKRLGEIIVAATKSYEQFDWAGALSKVEDFFWAEFCDDYLEMVKVRAKEDPSRGDRLSALATSSLTLSVLVRLFAPVLPTITEELWSRGFATKDGDSRSVHTSRWPSLIELERIESPAHYGEFAKARAMLRQERQKKAQAFNPA